MQFDYKYLGSSNIESGARDTNMAFVPDASRPPTFFRGVLGKHIAFREAISALHDVVVSDLRFKPKDRTEYLEWLAGQEILDWEAILAEREDMRKRAEELQTTVNDIQAAQRGRMQNFYSQRQKYFNYIYKVNYDAWFVLDPVITVHPDQIFFECFSQDESSYGCLSANYDVFSEISTFECGTTNIDYSQKLYDEFQKIRSYKTTKFEVDPSGFEVKTDGEDDYREVKIDLPDTWVRGFLQVSSAMTLPARTFDLHPLDVHNMCFILRRFKEKKGPRSMRYHLKPGHPIRITFDPWGYEVVCHRSIYQGPEEDMIRVWGRRRIHILERLIPAARKFTVHLLGRGLPSFYVADLGDMNFTLGLSGWTKNDWSASGNFDLLAPRMQVDDETKRRVFEGLKEDWLSTPDALAAKLGLDRAVVLGALTAYTQAGRVIYDLNKGVYRARELSRDPLPAEALRFSNEREEKAMRFLDNNNISIESVQDSGEGITVIRARVTDGSKTLTPEIQMNTDDRMKTGECQCSYYRHNRMLKGPCEHMLAARLYYSRMKS